MLDPKVTKPKLLDTSNKPGERVKPLKVRETTRERDLNVPCSVRGNRTVSCSRRPQRERSDTAPDTRKVALGSQRRTRAASTAPKLITQRCDAKPGNKKSRIYDKQTTAETKFRSTPPGNVDDISCKVSVELMYYVCYAFAMRYCVIGGCLSLEEVRQRQQQEMTQAKRKPKQVRSTVIFMNLKTIQQ
uniref:Uncharacterized protein n=1 Tax=Periophthalmus magnuspinnatus TaxID=409849 RepID=A0A3B3ZZL9_9GOBI